MKGLIHLADTTSTDTSTTTTSTTPQDDTYKQVFMTYQSQQADGNFYTVVYVPQDAVVNYPMTETPIPTELQGKVAKYNGVLEKWEDSNVDPNTSEIIALKNVNAELVKQLASATLAANNANQAATTANLAVAQLTKQLAADSASTTTTTAAK